MKQNKLYEIGYKAGSFIAVVFVACLTLLIVTTLVAGTAAIMRWMLF